MNNCLDEKLLLMTEQSNALSNVQGKCSAYQGIINILEENIRARTTRENVPTAMLTSQEALNMLKYIAH